MKTLMEAARAYAAGCEVVTGVRHEARKRIAGLKTAVALPAHITCTRFAGNLYDEEGHRLALIGTELGHAMAAAPDMLALLRYLRDEWFEPHYGLNDVGMAALLRDHIRAAIAKASPAADPRVQGDTQGGECKTCGVGSPDCPECAGAGR